MVQEYKNTDLDLFQQIDLTNPKDELLKKNKIGSSQQENNNMGVCNCRCKKNPSWKSATA